MVRPSGVFPSRRCSLLPNGKTHSGGKLLAERGQRETVRPTWPCLKRHKTIGRHRAREWSRNGGAIPALWPPKGAGKRRAVALCGTISRRAQYRHSLVDRAVSRAFSTVAGRSAPRSSAPQSPLGIAPYLASDRSHGTSRSIKTGVIDVPQNVQTVLSTRGMVTSLSAMVAGGYLKRH